MISLKIQIYTIIFSFIYGIFFSLLIDLNYKFIHSKKKFTKYLSSILIIIMSVIIYFIGIMKISYGVFHIYSILCILVGYTLASLTVGTIAKKKIKWYNPYIR